MSQSDERNRKRRYAENRRNALLVNLPLLFNQLSKDGRDMLKMLRDPTFRIPRVQLLKLAAAAAYIVSPIDLIPDFILILGWLDDAVVFGLGLKVLGEITNNWRAHRDGKPQRDAEPRPGTIDIDNVEYQQ